MSVLKVSPRTSSMTLRSACDGSCGSPTGIETSSSRSGRSTRRGSIVSSPSHLAPRHRHHSHHHHNHHLHNHRSHILSNTHLEQLTTLSQTLESDSSRVVSFSKVLKPIEKSPCPQLLIESTVPTLTKSNVKVNQIHTHSSSFHQSVQTEDINALRIGTWDVSRNNHSSSPSCHSSTNEIDLEIEADMKRIEGSNMLGHRSFKEGDISSSTVSSRSSFSQISTPCGSIWGSAGQRSLTHSGTSSPINDRLVNSKLYMENGSAFLGRQSLTSWTMRRSYGLDEESEEEMFGKPSRRSIPNKERKTNFYLFAGRSGYFLHTLLSGWCSFWSTIYWCLTSVHIFETWTLVRTRQILKKAVKKLWKVLIPLLLLLPFVLGGISWRSKDVSIYSLGNESFINSVCNIWDFPFNYVFYSAGPEEDDESSIGRSFVTEEHVATSWFDNNSFKKFFRAIIIQIYGKPEDDRKTLDLRSSQEFNYTTARLVFQEVIREELEVILGNLSDYRQWKIDQETKEEITTDGLQQSEEQNVALIAEFIRVEKQVEALESLTLSLKEDLEVIKMKNDEKEEEFYRKDVAWNEETGARLLALENVIHELKEKAVILEKQLQDSIRNCCKNSSEYAAFVEKYVTIALNKLSEAQDRNTQRWYSSIREWLGNNFVTKEEMNEHQNVIREKIVGALAAIDLDARVRSAVKEAAIAQSEGSTYDPLFSNTVRSIFKEEIAIYSADKTGLPDYALESSGGSVISTRCSETHQTHTAQFSILGIPLWYYNNSPRTVIQPGVNPGECWAFKGSTGYLVIQLSGRVRITAVSLEHIPKSISPSGNIDSAPKEFTVKGLDDEMGEGVFLGNYTYDDNGPALQTFPVQNVNPERAFPIVELIISSNHGNVEYTCLYRFRVHGSLIPS